MPIPTGRQNLTDGFSSCPIKLSSRATVFFNGATSRFKPSKQNFHKARQKVSCVITKLRLHSRQIIFIAEHGFTKFSLSLHSNK